MKNVVGPGSLLAVCMLMLFQVSCDDQDKLEAFLDNENPSVVTNLQTSEVSTQSLNLQWEEATDNVGVTAYEVFQNGVSIGLNGGQTSFLVEGLSPSTTYEYYVVAMDAMENTSDPSEALSVTTPAEEDTQEPSAPSNLESSALTQTSLTLSWDAATDNVEVVNYEVFQDGNSIGTTQGETTLDIDELTPSTSYEFYVIAMDAAGNSSPLSNTISVTTASDQDTEAPQAPTDLNASEITTSTLVLNWTASTDNEAVSSYEVFMGETAIGTTTQTTFNVSDLVAETSYQFKVRASDQAGNVSEFSQVLEVTTASAAPTQTVAQIIQSRDDLSTLNGVLSGFDYGLDDEESGPFTVFAPNNSAFTDFGTLPTGLALNALIAGHVVQGNLSSTELVDQGSATSGAGTTLNFTQGGSDVNINGNAKIIIKDIEATNGVIHIVDMIISN